MRRARLSRRPELERGFTLVEIFIVLGIIAILAGIGTPYFKDMVGRYRLGSAARATASYVSSARMLAVTRGTYVRILFTEIDTNAADEIPRGLFRVEERDRVTGLWKLVNDPSVTLRETTSSWAVSDCVDPAGGVLNEFCVDFKKGPSNAYPARFPSVSVVKVDDTELALGFRQIEFTPDGLVANELSDFTWGVDKQHIKIVLATTRRNGQLEFRIISVDRSGGVKVDPAVGVSIPTT